MAESFGVDAPRYDRARPRYPDALIQRVVAAAPGPDFLDVGCGTGIAARQFQAAGCQVLGVEPDARMAEFARGTGVAVEIGTVETWDPAGRTFDAVVAGQAWHWVDHIAGAAKASQVLHPGGLFAAFWHIFEAPQPVAAAFAEVYRRVVPDSPFSAESGQPATNLYQGIIAKVADGLRQSGFAEPERWTFEWERTYTRDQWLDLAPTTGGLTRLPPDKLAEILDTVGAAIDEIGGNFTMPFVTVAVAAART